MLLRIRIKWLNGFDFVHSSCTRCNASCPKASGILMRGRVKLKRSKCSDMYRGGRITRGRCDEMRMSYQNVFDKTDRFVMLGSENPKRVEQAYLNTNSSRAIANFVAPNRAAFLILTKTASWSVHQLGGFSFVLPGGGGRCRKLGFKMRLGIDRLSKNINTVIVG